MHSSRKMPPIPKNRSPLAALLGFAVTVLLVTWVLSKIAFVVAVVIILVTLALNVWENRRLRSLVANRSGETICTFARKFDRRSVDTWIIRGVYEGFQDYYEGQVSRFPVRITDNLERDLRIDEEDLEDLIEEIAVRIGRSLQNAETNPFYYRLKTVRDLVMFYVYQPKLHMEHGG